MYRYDCAPEGARTYEDPILRADLSDPDVIRVGEDYYMVASSFTYLPGVPLLHSRDMLHWRRPACQESLPWLLGTAGESRVELVSRCVSALEYDLGARRAIRRLKFSRRWGYVRTLGPLIAQCAADRLSGGFDAVTWVPLSRKSLRQRGFDQAELLARYVSETVGAPLLPTLVKAERRERQSSLRDQARRRANALGAYSLLPDAPVRDRRILLVDDVVTSGATLSECARILRMGGCADVAAVTLAKAGTTGW